MFGLISAYAPSKERLLAVLLHELQHSIQGIEGFSPGGNPDWADDIDKRIAMTKYDYRRTFGEAEANEVVHRRGKDATWRATHIPRWAGIPAKDLHINTVAPTREEGMAALSMSRDDFPPNASIAPVDYEQSDNFGKWTKQTVAKFVGAPADKHIYKALMSPRDLNPSLAEEENAKEYGAGERDDEAMALYGDEAREALKRNKEGALSHDERHRGWTLPMEGNEWTEEDALILAREMAADYDLMALAEDGGLEPGMGAEYPPPVVTIKSDGTTAINDGNHRINRFTEQEYDAIPVWVNDEQARTKANRKRKSSPTR